MSRRSRSGLPKYVSADRDRHGNLRFYFRREGRPKVRLHGTPYSPEWTAAYHAALAETTATGTKAENSLDWLCDRYYKSPKFRELEENTKRNTRAILHEICNIDSFQGKKIRRLGTLPFARLSKVHVVGLRDMRADKPGVANDRVGKIGALFNWAIGNDLAKLNPASAVGRLKNVSSGLHTWTESEVSRFEAAYPIGTIERLAFALMIYLGIRRSDARLLGPQHEIEDGKKITFTVFKNRNKSPTRLTLPILPPLRAIIDATQIDKTTFLQSRWDQPFASPNSFGNWFNSRVRGIGLSECTTHGLRKIGAVRCAEGGATAHELMAMFGWKDIKVALTYTRQADEKRLADQAAFKMMRNVPPIVPPR
jgi:integrase